MLQLPGCVIDENTDYIGKNKNYARNAESQEDCADLCASTDGALFWTFSKTLKACWVHSSISEKRENKNLVSGNRECGEAEGESSETGSDYSNPYWA